MPQHARALPPTTGPPPQRRHAAEYDALLAGLRYGAVAVNVPSLISFATTALGWGAYNAEGTPQVGRPARRRRRPGAWLGVQQKALRRCQPARA